MNTISSWKQTFEIARRCEFLSSKAVLTLSLFFFLTLANAVVDGISTALLINVLSGQFNPDSSNAVLRFSMEILIFMGLAPTAGALIFFLAALLLLSAALGFSISAMEGLLSALLRQKMQETGFAALLNGSWEYLREIRIGQKIGALTEETHTMSKYFLSMVKATYHLLSASILLIVALVISTKITLLMMAIGAPGFLVMKKIFSIQSRLSAEQVNVRQRFIADITDRLAGLFQIKAEGKSAIHIREGLRYQAPIARLEILIGYSLGAIGALNILLPVAALIAFYFWSRWYGQPLETSLPLLAGVGFIGGRAALQFNAFMASWGNLTRLSGSIVPVYQMLNVPREKPKTPITEPLMKVELQNAHYAYGQERGIDGINLSVEKGKPLVLRGISGSGKTTIANLIAGILPPHQGSVLYTGYSGTKYTAAEFRPKLGYVTQDIYLFHGTVRENLAPFNSKLSDEDLWQCLKLASADSFIRAMGGLDAQISESGKSLSGGEKRRLGIARVLAHRPDLAIVDEITVGLDEENKKVVNDSILNLSKTTILVIVTHEDTFKMFDTFSVKQG